MYRAAVIPVMLHAMGSDHPVSSQQWQDLESDTRAALVSRLRRHRDVDVQVDVVDEVAPDGDLALALVPFAISDDSQSSTSASASSIVTTANSLRAYSASAFSREKYELLDKALLPILT